MNTHEIAQLAQTLKPTCTPNGSWVLVPVPPQDREWLQKHQQPKGEGK